MRGNLAALAKGRETRLANAAARRATRIASGQLTADDARWLRKQGRPIPEGARIHYHPERTKKAANLPPKNTAEFSAELQKPGPVTFAPRQPQVYGLSEIPRRVVPGEVDELLTWGLPHFAVCFPDATRDNIRPMLMLACNGGAAHFVRTRHVVGLFALEKTPWNPLGTAHKVFVVAKQHAPAEVLAMYAEGERWAIACGAKWYHYEQCDGYPIEPIAQRIGHDATRVTYSKRLK